MQMASKKSQDSLIADLETVPSVYSGGVCKIKIIRDDMESEKQESLDRAVERVRNDRGQGRSKVHSATWLTKILRKNGYDISVSTVQRHVNKECPCERFN
jgi:hypothetical protein